MYVCIKTSPHTVKLHLRQCSYDLTVSHVIVVSLQIYSKLLPESFRPLTETMSLRSSCTQQFLLVVLFSVYYTEITD